MIKYICDKCGAELSELTAYRAYSCSKRDFVTLCRKCNKKYDKVIIKADAEFFKENNKNAAAVEQIDDTELQRAIGYAEGYAKGKNERPQGECEFIEILARYVPDDICTYPEYKGKPYYSIHYKQNGEDFVGFGTYKLEVLSRYLKGYFMKGGAE